MKLRKLRVPTNLFNANQYGLILAQEVWRCVNNDEIVCCGSDLSESEFQEIQPALDEAIHAFELLRSPFLEVIDNFIGPPAP